MGYTCTRPMKVQNLKTGKVELRQPGQPVPEAESWPNAAIWIKRGYIQADDHETAAASGYTRDKLLPARKATKEDIARGKNAPVPKTGEDLPGYQGQGDVLPVVTEKDDETLTEEQLLEMSEEDLLELGGTYDLSLNGAEKADMVLAILEAQEEATDEATKVALLKLKREDLETFAAEQGVEEPTSYPNKEALADAVMELAGE